MDKKERLIVHLNLADWMSLIALLFSSLALVQILTGKFFLAISLLFLGMFADTFDGMIARKFGFQSEFGRYLDGFIDLVTYLIAPVLFLYMAGNKDPVSLCCFFIFITAGILRLAKFNIIGNLKEGHKLYYTGCPVFWSLFLLVFLFLISLFLPHHVFTVISNILLIIMSFLMLWNKPFFKPQKYLLMAVLMLFIIAVFFIWQLTTK